MKTDALIIGSGLAGLSLALKLADKVHVTLISKSSLTETNSSMAQGGIAAVTSLGDSFEQHIEDTLSVGRGLCRPDVVKAVIEHGPQAIEQLLLWGVKFDREFNGWSLHKEGGHSQRRILHIADHTGLSINSQLVHRVLSHPNITIRESAQAMDLITTRSLQPSQIGPNSCLGVQLLDLATQTVETVLCSFTVLATGGAGRAYQYTSNWEGATGDGIALAYRAGARVANLEMMQFHPTCLYHPKERNLLISEALRGEGGELKNTNGHNIMTEIHTQGGLAPRDIVARAIDMEMKREGSPCVYLDMTHLSREVLHKKFPMLFERCLTLGIDMSQQPIPVVPAAHYLCGGVLSHIDGQTDLERLYVIGETAYTGLHGANRLASNSLLECLAMAEFCAQSILAKTPQEKTIYSSLVKSPPPIKNHPATPDELSVIHHMWDEIRRVMWDYVGIVRSQKRLERAHHRLLNINQEVETYYSECRGHPTVEELRNLSLVSLLMVKCALSRKESRGVHFNLDFPEENPLAQDTLA